MKKISFIIWLVAMLFSACSGGAPRTLTDGEVDQDTIQVPGVVIEREMASPDMSVFGSIQFGRVRTITSEDILAETPEVSFDENGQYVPSKRTETIIRDKQGRVANYNDGLIGKDKTGYQSRSTYTYVGESNQVASIISENTLNETQSVDMKRFSYENDLVYPEKMFELLQSGQWPSANYATYTYTRKDDNGNWLEREVKNYYFERPDFLLPDVMNQLTKEEAMQEVEKLLVEHLEDATATSYTEVRNIEYYQ